MEKKVGIEKQHISVKRKQKKSDIENEMTYVGPRISLLRA